MGDDMKGRQRLVSLVKRTRTMPWPTTMPPREPRHVTAHKLWFGPRMLMCLLGQDLSERILKVAISEGFVEESSGIGGLGARQGRLVYVSAHIDDTTIQMLTNVLRCFDSIHYPLEADIHQHQIRPMLKRLPQGFDAGGNECDNRISKLLESPLEASGDEALIFHD